MTYRASPAHPGPTPANDPVRAAADGPQFEMQAIGHALDDLSPMDKTLPRTGGVWRPVTWSVLGLIALMAFVGWLLVGPPLPH